ncbi:hypothetical protein [Ruminiclostridium josui]|nr:hypothetical protein [Ruminiclostridium josui]
MIDRNQDGGAGMNIEAYDLDSLRKIVRTLQKENEALKSQLKMTL